MDTAASPLANALGIAALAPLFIEWCKNSKLPFLGWIDHGTVMASRLLSLTIAAMTGAGMLYSFEGTTLTITGITFSSMLVFLWEMAKQFGLQELAYRAAVQPPKAEPAKPILDLKP